MPQVTRARKLYLVRLSRCVSTVTKLVDNGEPSEALRVIRDNFCPIEWAQLADELNQEVDAERDLTVADVLHLDAWSVRV